MAVTSNTTPSGTTTTYVDVVCGSVRTYPSLEALRQHDAQVMTAIKLVQEEGYIVADRYGRRLTDL